MALVSILRSCLGLNGNKFADVPKNPIRSISDSAQIFPLLDCLDSRSRVGLAREILEQQNPATEDGSAASPDPDAILYLAGILSDSVNAQTIQGSSFVTL